MKRTLFSVAAVICSSVVFYGCEDSSKAKSGADGAATVSRMTEAQNAADQIANRVTAPAVQGKQRGRQINAVNELKQIGLGFMMFMDNSDGRLPASIDQISSYCSGIDLAPYAYVGAGLGKVSSNTPIVFVKPEYVTNDMIAILYADGHVESKTISGISKMSCKKAAESISGNVESSVRKKIIKNAEKIK